MWVIMQQLNLQGDEVLVDAYCGIGTLTCWQKRCGLRWFRVQPEAVEQAQLNASAMELLMLMVPVEKYCPNWRLRRILY